MLLLKDVIGGLAYTIVSERRWGDERGGFRNPVSKFRRPLSVQLHSSSAQLFEVFGRTKAAVLWYAYSMHALSAIQFNVMHTHISFTVSESVVTVFVPVAAPESCKTCCAWYNHEQKNVRQQRDEK